MTLSYFGLLSGQPQRIEGIGIHVRSPKLGEILGESENQGTKEVEYRIFINALRFDKNDVIDYVEKEFGKELCDQLRKQVADNPTITDFEVMALFPNFMALIERSLNYFLVEKVSWVPDEKGFRCCLPNNTVAVIGKDKFAKVKRAILDSVYIGIDDDIEDDEENLTFGSEAAKIAWRKAHAAQKKLANSQKKDGHSKHPEYNYGNMVSKLCSSGIGYTFQNIYDLTIFQLHDAFFQNNYLRTIELTEMCFAAHGGKDFHFEDWMKPILDLSKQ